ncbi:MULTISPECIES: hypothetical protein [Methanocorpusculum]|jgi:hypothetical protein|uniref:Uncharacterized protein n=1 Tax=Methanocorpusculum parvum TaxID=2193 RepID=A0AAX0QAR4_9EURY|nr:MULTISPECIES: hypothetical protein [Methanocorpusculum]MDD2248913.1 hypothetical protein [Methanocorpusculum sp.]MDD2803489.1 hypothetical protein [Methanocorpusculum sp.]MDD3047218.1 hypothetical protein [Methanocorpusculum sp.]MDD4423855.1 hypothetical protein [Methanocorpusculum parvum]MDY3202730.1 hypothetical protein [Methanocorpusculum sp.]
MWESLKEQIQEVGCAKMTGADASAYIKNDQVIFVYEGNRLPIQTAPESAVTIRHIGGGSVKLTYKFIEVLAKIERPE